MSQPKRNRTTIELGHDAFLDIVANLVGVLIILVVVLGMQSSQVIEQIKQKTDAELVLDEGNKPASETQLASLGQVSMRAASALADSERLEASIKQYDNEIEQRENQRRQLIDFLSVAQTSWEEEKEKFDKQATIMAKRNREFEETKNRLAELQGQRERLEGEKTPIVAITHLPTPMARTVFGDEIHFRLKGNRLSVVPIEHLIQEIKGEFERSIGGSRDGVIDAAVGPIRGYVAHYEMAKTREMVARGGQVGMATRVALVGMTITPLKEPTGTTIKDLYVEGSELDIELAGRDPATTTITVWVYPDSFAAFRHLKEHLYSRGFAAAARPLPMGREITGSPQGSRSSAQ